MTNEEDSQGTALEAKRSVLRRVLNVVFALGGVGLFAYLVRASGVSWSMIDQVGWDGMLLLILVSWSVITFDTIAWFYAIRDIVRPSFVSLFGLRLAGDALTNGVPGGVVLGETFKAVALKNWYGVSLSASAGALILIKFGLGISQSIFVLIGLMIAYPHLAARSVELFGFPGAHLIALGATIFMGAALLAALVMITRGGTLTKVVNLAKKLPIARFRRYLERKSDRILKIEETISGVIHDHKKYVPHVFGYLLVGWFASAGETWVLLRAMGYDVPFSEAYAIESVGSLFRLIFFMVPSGIGGQDASFFALFRLYDLPDNAVGLFVIIKRVKELIWIGIGLILVGAFRARFTERREGERGVPLASRGN